MINVFSMVFLFLQREKSPGVRGYLRFLEKNDITNRFILAISKFAKT